ncbi:hypothetical protein JYU34_012902 [Plutella xylostella]|uniref:Multiple inositol polyphosphate phosphatase 1 n=1 Tax=Plutella xylostella TaxID=51655 RepID=A0ABQ7QCX1_PLUXY|nr:hypothetical protein JYU34_012902 [Plutella xylostella]
MGWIALSVLALVCAAQAQEVCLSAEEDPYLLFGTKTAYNFAHTAGISTTRIQDVIGCSPIAFWSLNRHGSHNPELNEINELQRLQDLRDNIIANCKNGNFRNTNQRMCTSDVNLLERWQWSARHTAASAGDLTSEGYVTAQNLAQAWRQRYPGLLTDNRHDYLVSGE